MFFPITRENNPAREFKKKISICFLNIFLLICFCFCVWLFGTVLFSIVSIVPEVKKERESSSADVTIGQRQAAKNENGKRRRDGRRGGRRRGNGRRSRWNGWISWNNIADVSRFSDTHLNSGSSIISCAFSDKSTTKTNQQQRRVRDTIDRDCFTSCMDKTLPPPVRYVLFGFFHARFQPFSV